MKWFSETRKGDRGSSSARAVLVGLTTLTEHHVGWLMTNRKLEVWHPGASMVRGGPSSGSQTCSVLTWQKGLGSALKPVFKGTDPIHEGSFLMTKYLLKALPTRTIIFGGGDLNKWVSRWHKCLDLSRFHNRTPWAVWLEQQKSLLKSSGGWKSGVSGPAWSVLGKAGFLFADGHLLTCPHEAFPGKRGSRSRSLSCQVIRPVKLGAYTSDLTYLLSPNTLPGG